MHKNPLWFGEINAVCIFIDVFDLNVNFFGQFANFKKFLDCKKVNNERRGEEAKSLFIKLKMGRSLWMLI
ncbi:MAG: hypothetical protein CO171_06140 [Syntrophobacterales bacterium CG_4_9_14_3_um_filter_49_8]|nr:MAG: hypothetical protein COX52_13510 [Syntrophobacterales bacterium CG23_combo_of_CG06-09_8_20_14_all_48_27]PJA48988.1 MAG: hypothetical protein CO171_06140 [Syntrophobacterales bacterium CG_4_9_14_3_um_filter_49_8]